MSYPEEVRSRAVELYANGMPFLGITAETGAPRCTIRKWIQLEWPDPTTRPTRRSGAPSKYTAEQRDQVLAMRGNGTTYPEISRATGVAETTIRKWAQRARPEVVRPNSAVYRGFQVGVPPEAWEVDAACLDVGPELFFPVRGEGESVKPAKQICAGCTVREKCLDKALRSRTEWGIWGGLTWTERKRLLKEAKEA